MSTPFKLAAIGLAALAIAACSGTSSTTPGPIGNGLMPTAIHQGGGANMDLSKVHVMGTLANHMVAAQPDIQLNYNGGNVEVKAQVYVVFWGFGKSGGDPSKEKAYLTKFLQGVGGSKWMNIDHQYYQIIGGKKSLIQNNAGMLKGGWVDDTNAEPTNPSDAQIQAEAGKLEAHFGFQRDASYVVATSHSHNSPGFGTSYCAYHGATTAGGKTISYTNLPYMTDAGANCGEDFINPGTKGLLDGVSIVEGHEYAESQTDPEPPSGWYNNSYGEIGDICAWQKPPAADITLSTGKFAVQGLFDNKKSACEISGP